MLAFAHIPTGTAANTGFDIDEVNSRIRRTSRRAHCDRSRHRNRQGYTLRRGSGCRTFGVHLSALRLAYLISAAYKRAICVNTLRKLEEKIVAAAKAGAHEQVRSIALQILSTEYINLLGHKFLRQSCAKLNDDPCKKRHHFIEFGLLQSITSSGNGKTCDTAWEVVTVEEEYFILNMLGVKPNQQALSTSASHRCDEMHINDNNGSEKTYYFNIDAMFNDNGIRSDQAH